MSRIDIENAKAIRKAMNVVCGMEMLTDLRPVATSSDSYDNVNGDVYSVPVFVQYMDLSGDGFPNDGSAQPYEADHAGIIAQADADGQSSMELTVTFTGTPSALDREAQEATVYYYEGDKLKSTKLIFEDIPHAFPGTRTVTIESTAGRIQIVRVTFGYSWWFDNDSLVSCNLTLRGIETRLDNPELQLSQIEITGYEPENILDKAAMISDNAPIYYACGYPGDMSPVRKFYLSEVISWAENQIVIKGEDATRFLDKDYAGKYVGNYNADGGGLGRYITTVHDMLTDAGIEHEYINELTTGPYADGEPFFIKNVSKRSIVAQAMNLFRFPNDWLGDCYVSYVDAGIPKFTATGGNNTPGWNIEDYTDIRIETQRRIKSVEMDIPLVDVGTSVAIETVQTEGTTIRELTDPYRTVAASSGTVSMITPYKYKLRASGNSNITGRPIRFYDPTVGAESQYVPYKRSNSSGVEAVVLSEFCGMENGASPEPGYVADFWEEVFAELLSRGIKTYSFTWRGDPRMQPRDYITLEVDGHDVDMTIESITLDHTDGGLTSQIVAREGFI